MFKKSTRSSVARLSFVGILISKLEEESAKTPIFLHNRFNTLFDDEETRMVTKAFETPQISVIRLSFVRILFRKLGRRIRKNANLCIHNLV
jgi:hypothetical protein